MVGATQRSCGVVGAVLVLLFAATGYSQESTAPPSQVEPLPEPAGDDAATAEQDGDDKWRISAPLYVWAFSIDGDVTARGSDRDVDVEFSDIFDHTDLGVQAYVEIGKGKWAAYVQPNYLKLSDDGKLANIKYDVELEIWIVEFGGLYRLWQGDLFRPMRLEAIAGGRYWGIGTDVDVKAPAAGNPDFQRDLIDPLVGLRHHVDLTDWLHLSTRVDVGGFDISSKSSNLSWQTVGVLTFDITKRLSLLAGYRALGIDYHRGAGSREHGLDLIMHGMLLGLSFELF